MIDFYLVRHGETAWNSERRIQGHTDIPLNETGHRQARLAAGALAGIKACAVITSDLERAAETARIIAAPHQLIPQSETGLREASLGEWESLTLDEIAARFPEEFLGWRDDPALPPPPGGESLHQVAARVDDVMDALTEHYPDGKLIVVGHGGSIRAAIHWALEVAMRAMTRIRLDNGSITHIRVQQANRTLMSLNDVCHLQGQSPHFSLDETARAPDPYDATQNICDGA